LRPVDIDVVLLEAIFVRHFQRVAMALGGEKRCCGAASFYQGICGQRRTVKDQADVGRRQSSLLHNSVDAGEYRITRVCVGRQQLRRYAFAVG